MRTRILLYRLCKKIDKPAVTMTGQPPFRSIVSTIMPDGPDYESLFGLPGVTALSDAQIETSGKIFHVFKKQRAERAVQGGAKEAWGRLYIEGHAGWGVTVERTQLAATMMLREC